jgi:hypothetical protein
MAVLVAFVVSAGSAVIAQAVDWEALMDADLHRFGAVANVIPLEDQDIRAAFVGHWAAGGWTSAGQGPHEFRSDGTYFRQGHNDLNSGGRYVIAGGRICIELTRGLPRNACYEVLRARSQYFLQDVAGGPTVLVTLGPISEPAK